MKTSSVLKRLDATAGRLMLWALKHVARSVPMDRFPALQAPSRILVIRPGGMGDMVLLLPLIDALKHRFPAASIDLLCERRNRAVLELSGLDVTPLLYDEHPLRCLRAIRRRRYEVVVDSEQFHHFSAALAFLSRAPVRIGFKINPSRNPLYTHLINYHPDGPEPEQFLKLLGPFGILRYERPVPGFLSTALPRSATPDRLVVHVGASCRYKAWPEDRFGACLVKLTAATRNRLTPVLIGTGADRGSIGAVMRGTREAGLVPETRLDMPLDAAVELLRRASLFLGSDSGLAHVAVALGVPTVILFGPSDDQKWGHTGAEREIVRHALPCAPCFIFGYCKPCRAIACMSAISVDDVVAACLRVLRQSGVETC